MEGADALDDHDAGWLDGPGPARLPCSPVIRGERRRLAATEWRDDLPLEALEIEAGAVPELVRGDDLGSGNHPRERRLSRRAVPADADERQPVVLPRGGDEFEHRTGVHRSTVPSPHGQAAARRHGSLERGSRPRSNLMGRRGAGVRRLDPSGLRRQAAVRTERDDAVRPRPAADRRGVRGAPRCAPRAPRGALSVRAATRRGCGRRRGSSGGHCPALAARVPREGSGRRLCLAGPCRDRAAGRRPRLVPRRRAHFDRHLRDGRAGDEGARPLRRPSRRPADPDERCRERAGGAGSRLGPSGSEGARRRRRDGRRGRDLRLDGPPSRAATRRALSRVPATSCRRASRRPSRRRRSSRWRKPRSPPVSRPKSRRDPGAAGARRAARPRCVRPSRREDAGGLLHRRVLQPHPRDAARRRPPPAGRDAGLPAAHRHARRHGRGDRGAQALLRRLGRARGLRALRRRHDRAVGDGDDDRGRLHPLRPSRDRLSRRPGAAHADRDQHRARAPRRERQAHHLHGRPARPPPRADRRRLRGVRRRRDPRQPRSASPPTRRPPGGAAVVSAPSRMR